MKPWYKSRAIWLGVAAVVAAACGAVIPGATWQSVALAAVGALGVYLRTQTDTEIG